jgi:hypothetical protein
MSVFLLYSLTSIFLGLETNPRNPQTPNSGPTLSRNGFSDFEQGQAHEVYGQDGPVKEASGGAHSAQ